MLEPTKLANLDNLQKAIKLGKAIEQLRTKQRSLRRSKRTIKLIEYDKYNNIYYGRAIKSEDIFEVSTEFLAEKMQKLIDDKLEELHQLGYTI